MIGDSAARTFRLKDGSVVTITTTTERDEMDAAYPKRIEVVDNGEEVAYLAGKGALVIEARGGQLTASSATWTIYKFEQTEESGRVLAKIVIALIKSILRAAETDNGGERGEGSLPLTVIMPTIPASPRDVPPPRRSPEPTNNEGWTTVLWPIGMRLE